ncbi:hypothetical protein GCM10010361_33140 [Streptomyces olivaceiscleroticus]|uniref:Uncharacterized protein n=1 Tax=Streptomyces olivaceiscleroticus TaxID=68245 RepID=A0ABP3JZE3_9ACTN
MRPAGSSRARAARSSPTGRRAAAREVGERVDLAGEASQVGRNAAGRVAPGSSGAVGGAGLSGGLDALFAGGPGRAGAAAQVAALGGLAAGDAEGRARSAQLAPALQAVSIRPIPHPAIELLSHLPQQHRRSQDLFRAGRGRVGALGYSHWAPPSVIT